MTGREWKKFVVTFGVDMLARNVIRLVPVACGSA
jgi:hypothetical protein